MRRVIETVRTAPRVLLSLAIITALIQGCGSDPTNPAGGGSGDPPNAAPVAAAGPDAAVSVGIPVALDGSGSSDADGDAVTYAWTLSAPAGSAASLDDATSETPSFVPDVEGAYVASLTVNDGTDDSAADQATITATDNTITGTVVAASGGSVASSDGALTLTIPAGALGTDTDISVTRLGASQLPAVVRALPGDKTAYDLGPDGTTFSTPVKVALDVPGAVTTSSGSASMSGAFLLSESGGTIEGMSNVVLAQDDVDPTKAAITGSLSHFSHAIFVAMSMEFRIDAPDAANVDEPFDVTFTIDITGAGLQNIASATVQDVSIAPVGPYEQTAPFQPTMVISGDEATITNSYVCFQEGQARIRANMQFEATDQFGSVVTVQLGKSVTCRPPPIPLETTIIPNLYRAQRLLPVPGSTEEITTGGLVRRINLATNAVTELSQASGDPPEWVSALSDGNYLVHSTLGSVDWLVPGGDPTVDTMFVTWYDQPRHVAMVAENTIALATAFGDLGFMTYTPGGASGSFQDAFRDLLSMNNPQQSPETHLQAIWVSPDAQTFIGAVTEGNGDSAFNDTRAAIIDADVQSGQLSVTPLPGMIDDVLDPQIRHQFDLECGPHLLPTRYLCVFTSGHDSPAGSNPNMDVQNDGYLSIFIVDTFDETAELVHWEAGNARVGGGVFSVDASTTGVAVSNQFTEALDVWHVQGTQVVQSFPVALDQPCENPTDFILIADGLRGALTCQAPVTTDYSVLVIRNLNTHQPPGS